MTTLGMMHRNVKKAWLPPTLLGLFTLLVRYIYAGLDRVVWGDEPFYLWLGRSWFNGSGYHLWFVDHWDYHHTPGYPFITAVLTLFTRDMTRASEWSYILFGVWLALVVYFLTRRIYGDRSALAAGLLIALAPATAMMPLMWGTMTEPPYWALALTGVFFAYRAFQRFRALDIVLSGVFLALAYYVRPEAVVYLGAMGLILGLRALSRPPRWRNLGYPALLGVVFLLVIFPYLAKVHQETGVWTISQKVGANFATAEGLALGDFRQFDVETWGLDSTGEHVRFFSHETADASALDYILSDPIAYARILYGNTRKLLTQLFNVHLFPWYLLIPLAVGLFRRAWSRERAWNELFLAFTLLPGLSFILFFVQERYIAALVPTLFIWAGHGLVEMGDWLRETAVQVLRGEQHSEGGGLEKMRWMAWLPTALLMAFFLVITPRQADSAYLAGSVRPVHVQAAEELAPYVQPGDVLMSRYVAIAWHSGAEWLPTPAASIDETLAYARHHGAKFWAIDGYEAHRLRPQFAPLVDDPENPPEGLKLLLVVPDDSGKEPVVIYQIEPPS
jgi:4-amino-4-deoxy-L-arabinose transferase-like glycosyltransferase